MATLCLSVLIFAIHYYQSNAEIIPCDTVPCVCNATLHGETCTLDCIGQAVCRNKVLSCRNGDPCNINCERRRACQGASITCPMNSDCTIHCTKADSCHGNSGGAFNVTLNQAKSYQCIASDQVTCPPINEVGEPYVPAPFTSSPTTAAPTTSPSTRNPTTNGPTLSPATATPTLTITQSPTTRSSITTQPTLSPVTTAAPSKHPTNSTSTPDPTTTPISVTSNPTNGPIAPSLSTDGPTTVSTNAPTLSPNTRNPVTNSPTFATSDPTTIDPSVSPSTSNPTVSTADPTQIPSLEPTTQIPSVDPTQIPSLEPTTQTPSLSPTTQIPSLSPTTQIPSLSPSTFPTLYPTVQCTDWTITLVFSIAQYAKNDGWQNGLRRTMLNAFQRTILLQFNGTWYDHEWCVNIEIQIQNTSDRRRTLLQNAGDIHVTTTFTFNTLLYEEYFIAYNATAFTIRFEGLLVNEMAQNVDAFTVEHPMEVTDTPSPTYTKHDLQTRKGGHNRETIIMSVLLAFGLCCAIVIVYACRMWYRHEMAYEDRFNHSKRYAKVAPTTPSATTGLENAPVTPVPETTGVELETVETAGDTDRTETIPANEDEATNEEVEEDRNIKSMMNALSTEGDLDKQTSFEIRLSGHKKNEDSLIGHMIQEIKTNTTAGMDLREDSEDDHPVK